MQLGLNFFFINPNLPECIPLGMPSNSLGICKKNSNPNWPDVLDFVSMKLQNCLVEEKKPLT